MTVVIGIVMMLFLNYNNIENNYQDYQIYHILGMSYQEIRKKQMWKSVHMTCVTAIPILLYFIVLIIFSIDHYTPILQTLGLLAGMFLVYLIIYNIPLYFVMKNHKNKELRNEE